MCVCGGGGSHVLPGSDRDTCFGGGGVEEYRLLLLVSVSRSSNTSGSGWRGGYGVVSCPSSCPG